MKHAIVIATNPDQEPHMFVLAVRGVHIVEKELDQISIITTVHPRNLTDRQAKICFGRSLRFKKNKTKSRYLAVFLLCFEQSIRRPEAWFCQRPSWLGSLTDSGRGQKKPPAGKAFVSVRNIVRKLRLSFRPLRGFTCLLQTEFSSFFCTRISF